MPTLEGWNHVACAVGPAADDELEDAAPCFKPRVFVDSRSPAVDQQH
jgi:hypothetical protein